MKLISLNIWGGIVHDLLLKFIRERSSDIDIFCFQEVLTDIKDRVLVNTKARTNIFGEISAILTDFKPLVAWTPSEHFQSELLGGAKMGEVIFVRNKFETSDQGEFVTYSGEVPGMIEGAHATGNCHWVKLKQANLTIGNIHGLWQRGSDKNDTPERLRQSEIVRDFFGEKPRTIVCGDFNLHNDGRSVAILEQKFRNLIREYQVTSTRSGLYKKSSVLHADFAFVSQDLLVKDFRVLQDEVSDHLPLYLEFEV